MISVFHLIKSLGRGGAETLLAETIQHHDKRSYQFFVGYFLPWKDQLVQEIEDSGCEVICFNKKSNWQIINSVDQVSRIVSENKIDIIHAHLPWAGILARQVGRKTGIPVLYTEHNKQERYHPLTRWLNKLTYNQNSAVIAVSDDVKESITKNIQPNTLIKTILNGVNTSKYNPQSFNKSELRKGFGLKEDDIVIGTVAVFRKQKRLDKWVETVSEMHSNYPDTRFIMLGDGPEEEKIMKIISSNGLEKNFILPGRLREVRDWLAVMDIFLMTSEHEGLPVALLEAMSMGLPVVATDAGGIKEVVRDGVEGFLKSVDRPNELEEPLARLVDDEGLRIEMGNKGRERVKEDFSLERMVNELEKTYSEFLHR